MRRLPFLISLFAGFVLAMTYNFANKKRWKRYKVFCDVQKKTNIFGNKYYALPKCNGSCFAGSEESAACSFSRECIKMQEDV